MIECDMCYKGIIRTKLNGEEIKCKYCNGTGEIKAKNVYAESKEGEE